MIRLQRFLFVLALLTIFSICANAQGGDSRELGTITLYQQVCNGGEWNNNQANMAFVSTHSVIVSYTLEGYDYCWRDSITSTDSFTRMVDIDEDGRNEQLRIVTYFTDNGGIYKHIFIDGSPSMLTAEGPTSSRIQFAGCMRHSLAYRSAVEAEFNTNSISPVSGKLR